MGEQITPRDADALPSFVDATIVAPLLGFATPEAFLRARRDLEDDEWFPAPVSWCSRPLKWRGSHVAHWLRRQDEAYLADFVSALRRGAPSRSDTYGPLELIDGGRT